MPQHLQKSRLPLSRLHTRMPLPKMQAIAVFFLHRFGPFRMSDSFLVEPTFLFIGSIFP